jgi:DNA invertase Pin-like site-specific DNA recombinase
MKHTETPANGAPVEPTDGACRPQRSSLPALWSSKILAAHLDRLAIVYVRQSTMQQVFQHGESRERQYELAELACHLGWPHDRVLVIDDDQGQSAQSATHRQGFQRLLAEVSMNHVGIVLGLEMSRLARSSADFQQLVQLCSFFGTLLADQEGVYNPQDANDRLLLGLKGTMSEFELVTMRNRLECGKLHKAQRCALFHNIPLGYWRSPSGEVELDPDEQVRAVVALIFAKFDELGSVGALLRYLASQQLRVGMRVQHGPRRGQVVWRPPHVSTLRQLLHHPIYTGAYVYGRYRHRRVTPDGPRQTQVVPPSEWKVLKHDRLPAYISWEQYVRNQARLQDNRPSVSTPGPVRAGTALLAGLAVCGRCGHRLKVHYPRRGRPYYRCRWSKLQRGVGPACFGVSAPVVDELVAQQILEVLTPAALELRLQAQQQIEDERRRLEQHWQYRLERARYDAERAERQYQAVEPDNRLVARTLEQRWEEALRQQRQLNEEYDRFCRHQPVALTELEHARLAALAEDIPALWAAATTTALERKEIARCLIERVVIGAGSVGDKVLVTIHWQGGQSSRHEVVRPVQTLPQSSTRERLLARVRQLRAAGASAGEIAACLNEEGFVPPQRRGPYNADTVRQLLVRTGLASGRRVALPLERHEHWLQDMAARLGMSETTLRRWIRRGWVHARQVPVQKFWVVWADRSELRRLRRLRRYVREGGVEFNEELMTPKKR